MRCTTAQDTSDHPARMSVRGRVLLERHVAGSAAHVARGICVDLVAIPRLAHTRGEAPGQPWPRRLGTISGSFARWPCMGRNATDTRSARSLRIPVAGRSAMWRYRRQCTGLYALYSPLFRQFMLALCCRFSTRNNALSRGRAGSGYGICKSQRTSETVFAMQSSPRR